MDKPVQTSTATWWKPVQRRNPTVGEQSSVGLTRLAGHGRSDSGAYGCNPTVLSTLRNPTLKVLHDTEVYDTHSVVHIDGDVLSYPVFRNLVSPNKAGIVPIPVLTSEGLGVLRSGAHASSSEVAKGVYGLCTFIFSLSPALPGLDERVTTSCICLHPGLVKRLAVGDNPKLVDTRLLKHLREHGVKYPPPPELAPNFTQPQAQEDFDECCICLASEAVYKLNNCSHGAPLVCLVCRNLLNSRSGPGALIPCPICRTAGILVKAGLKTPTCRPPKKKKARRRPIK